MIPWDLGDRIGNARKWDGYSVCQFWFWEGWPGLESPVEEDINPAARSPLPTTAAKAACSQNKHVGTSPTHRRASPAYFPLQTPRPHLTQPNGIVFITEQHTDRRQETFVLYPMALVKRKTWTNKLARISLARGGWWRARVLSMSIQVDKQYYEVPFKPRCLLN